MKSTLEKNSKGKILLNALVIRTNIINCRLVRLKFTHGRPKLHNRNNQILKIRWVQLFPNKWRHNVATYYKWKTKIWTNFTLKNYAQLLLSPKLDVKTRNWVILKYVNEISEIVNVLLRSSKKSLVFSLESSLRYNTK